jgi:hypothetical protein
MSRASSSGSRSPRRAGRAHGAEPDDRPAESLAPGRQVRSDRRARGRARRFEEGIELPTAMLEGPEREIKLLSYHQDDLVGERTRVQNRLRWAAAQPLARAGPPGRLPHGRTARTVRWGAGGNQAGRLARAALAPPVYPTTPAIMHDPG